MFNLKRSLAETKKKIRPGNYISEVVNITWAPGYVKDKAIEIRYKLIDEDGNMFPFKEIFLTDPEHDRSATFFDYLDDNGIEDIEDFLGVKESVTIMRDVANGATFANIVNRAFLTEDIDDTSSDIDDEVEN